MHELICFWQKLMRYTVDNVHDVQPVRRLDRDVTDYMVVICIYVSLLF